MNKISVAVVDDNEKIVETICNELERDEEINIVGKAKNGEEAFDIIKKTNPDVVVLDLIRDKEPDVVLLDMIMPKMDGLSLMNKIHKDGSIIKLPFFIITSAISNETADPLVRSLYLSKTAPICLPVHCHDDLYVDLRCCRRSVCVEFCRKDGICSNQFNYADSDGTFSSWVYDRYRRQRDCSNNSGRRKKRKGK